MIIHGAMTVLLLCLLGEARGAGVDLGLIRYEFRRGYHNEQYVTFYHNVVGYSMQLSCTDCVQVVGAVVYCAGGALVKVTADLYRGGDHVYVPFNVSCDMTKNAASVGDLTASTHLHSIQLSWRLSHESIDKYIIHLVAQGEYRNTAVTTRSPSFLLEGLKERTEYQICVATVDGRSETGRYRCMTQRTDSLKTGPVVGVNVTASITSVVISWRKPLNDLYAPSSYTVDYRDPRGGSCERIVVTIGTLGETPHRGTPPGCVLRRALSWTELKPLTIDGLLTCTLYDITILPVNRGKAQVAATLGVTTREGRLGVVEVRDIESSPRGQMEVSWRYLGQEACSRFYRVRYESKFIKGSAVTKETKGTSITLENLARNTLYTVAVRAETRMDTEGGAKEGSYSAEKEFYTGSVVPGIYDYKEDFTAGRKRLNISWSFNSSGDGSVFDFILRVKNAFDSCISTTHFLCRSCPPPYSWASLDKGNLTIRQRLLRCSRPSVIKFTKDTNNLHRSLDIAVATTNFTVEIHAINLAGVHLVCGGRNACKKAERDSPKKVEAAERSSTSITFRWPKMIGDSSDRPPLFYELSLMKSKVIIKKRQSVATEASFDGLAMCTEYCVTVYRVVTPGKSLFDGTGCQYTLAPSLGMIEVDKIESGPLGDRVVTWRYTGRDNCARSYVVRYGNKHMKTRVTHLETNGTNVTLRNLDTDAVYTVEVSVQASVTTAGRRKVSEAKEFYTGEVTPQISGYEQYMSFESKVLKVSWLFDPSYDGSVFEFIVRVKNEYGVCILSSHLSCQTCPSPYFPENLDDWHRVKRRELLLCSNINKATFKKDDSSFHHIFEVETPLTSFSVEIFATNLMGVHRVYGDGTVATTKDGETSKKIAFFASSKRLKVKGSLTERAVLLDSLVTNAGNAYNNGTGEFRAPVSGVYVFAITISAPRAAKVAVKLIKDTETVLTLRKADSQSAPSSIQIVLEVRKNGRVWLQYDKNTPLLHGQMLSTFSGYLLFDLS